MTTHLDAQVTAFRQWRLDQEFDSFVWGRRLGGEGP
jgi:hypothetical protein